jgi:hypothetical protein
MTTTLSRPRTRSGPADLSLHRRKLLRRAGSPDLQKWLAHTAGARGCHHPVRLTGQLHTVEPDTGRILQSRHTVDLPDGVIYVPCGDRRASVCPPCAETYRADTYQLIKAGLVGGKGVPTTVAGHPAVFATLTAPSFGPVHTRTVNPTSGKVRPCHIDGTSPPAHTANRSSARNGTPNTRPPWAGRSAWTATTTLTTSSGTAGPVNSGAAP